MTELKRKMASGAAWLVLFRLTDRSIGFISTLVLARLLVPADFGIVAMGSSILAALELLGAFSFDIALIQNQNAERKHYDTAWTFGVYYGLFKAVAMCLLAGHAALFFNEPRVESLMFALALCTLIQGFDNIGVVAFQKNLELHKEFWFGLAKKLSGFVVTIALAFYLQSFWALIAGTLASRLVSLVLSYRLHPYRPQFSLAAFSELFHFSKWLLLNNILVFLNNRGTDLVIGRISGPKALGQYSLSYEIANLPTTELVFPISRAVFPGYAKLAANKAELRGAFLQVIGLVGLLTIPAGAGIGLIATPLVQLLLGSQWMDVVPLIEVLAVFGIVRSIHGPTGSIYLAVGRPRMVALLQCVQLAVAISLMLIWLPSLGPLGAAYAILAGASIAMAVNYWMMLAELEMSLSELSAVFWRPMLASLVMAGCLKLFQRTWHLGEGSLAAALHVPVLIGLGAVAYLATLFLSWWLQGKPAGAEQQILKFAMARLTRS